MGIKKKKMIGDMVACFREQCGTILGLGMVTGWSRETHYTVEWFWSKYEPDIAGVLRACVWVGHADRYWLPRHVAKMKQRYLKYAEVPNGKGTGLQNQ